MKNIKFISVLVASFLLVFLVAVIVWASLQSNVFVGFDQLIETRWGVATLVDIYIALTFIGVWIGVMENSVIKGIVWTLALYIFGNIATLIYFVYRATKSRSFTEIFLPKS